MTIAGYKSSGRHQLHLKVLFCEVAASLDYLFDGPGGYSLEKGWWKHQKSFKTG